MGDTSPLQPGDVAVTVQLSPCVGGLVRTWTDDGESRLWSTPHAEWLLGIQGTGAIARTPQEDRRFREAALLSESNSTLIVQARSPVDVEDGNLQVQAHVLRLAAPGRPGESVFDDLRALLAQAIRQCVTDDEFLVVEQGGWDTAQTPFCLFIVLAEGDGWLSVIETAPAPYGSEFWNPHIVPGRETNSLTAPATPETLEVAPILMLEAIAGWGLDPWDLALTFGRR